MTSEAGVLMAFPVHEAARLTAMSIDTLRRWSESGLFEPQHKDFELYSFRDIVGLRTLVKLKAKGLSVQKLRKAGEVLRIQHASPWSSLRFFTAGNMLYFGDPTTGERYAVVPLGQKALPIDLAMEPIVTDVENEVRRSRARSPKDFGQLEQKRGVCGNAMRVKGTRITTATIAAWKRDGASNDELIEQYPALHPLDISAALEYERKLPHRRKAG